jgi:hypothetical protein
MNCLMSETSDGILTGCGGSMSVIWSVVLREGEIVVDVEIRLQARARKGRWQAMQDSGRCALRVTTCGVNLVNLIQTACLFTTAAYLCDFLCRAI